jgi:hypothetical protein
MKMLGLTILSTVVTSAFLSAGASAQHISSLTEKDCASVLNGQFRYQPGGKGTVYTISRKDSLQTETKIENGERSMWRVRWLDPCNFTLSSIGVNRPWIEGEEQFWKMHKVVVRVLQVTDQYYVFESSLDSLALLHYYLKDTAWVTP